MRILILVNSLTMGGGMEKFAVTLGNHFYEKGNSIFYLTITDTNPKYDFKGEYFTLNQSLIYPNKLLKILQVVKNVYKISRFCNKNKIDIILSVGGDLNCQSILCRNFFKNKTKIIATHHGNPEILLENRITASTIKFLYPKADKIVCVSKEMEEIFNNKFDINKNILTINNMVDINNSLEMAKEQIDDIYGEIFKSGFIFINIGRLDYQKGQWFLIRSFKKVVDKHKEAKLIILGGTSLSYVYIKNHLEDLIQSLGLENNVFLLGKHENIFKFLNRCDCFVLSSLYEGFAFTLIEALTTNIPIISTDCKTGSREILAPELELYENIEYPYFGQFGILCMPFSNKLFFENIENKKLSKAEKVYCETMIKMIEDNKLKNKYSNGLDKAKEFDKHVILKNWENFLKIF